MCFASTPRNLIFFHPDAFSLEGGIVLIATLGRKYQTLCLQITSGNQQDRTVDNCVIVSGSLTSLKTSEQSKYPYVRYKIFPNLFSSFWKGFPKGGSGLCADALFSQLLGRAVSSFWQSGEADMTYLERKEPGKLWRIKPEKNKWVDSMNRHIFSITSFLCTSHIVMFYSAPLPSGWISVVWCPSGSFLSKSPRLGPWLSWTKALNFAKADVYCCENF